MIDRNAPDWRDWPDEFPTTDISVADPSPLFKGFRVWTVQRQAGVEDIVIDPHGACRGQHDVIITTTRMAGMPHAHLSVSWGASIFLSQSGAESFAVALALAFALMDQIRTTETFDLEAAMATVLDRL